VDSPRHRHGHESRAQHGCQRQHDPRPMTWRPNPRDRTACSQATLQRPILPRIHAGQDMAYAGLLTTLGMTHLQHQPMKIGPVFAALESRRRQWAGP
jgi:hypothetical protein